MLAISARKRPSGPLKNAEYKKFLVKTIAKTESGESIWKLKLLPALTSYSRDKMDRNTSGLRLVTLTDCLNVVTYVSIDFRSKIG